MEEKKITKRYRWSNFLITINTNLRFDIPDGPEYLNLEQRLVDTFSYIIDSNNIWNYLLLREKGVNKPFPNNPEFIESTFKEVETSGRCEVAPQTKCLHLHGFMRFKHRTTIQLNHSLMEKDLKEKIGIPIYLNFKGTGDANLNFENYINKYYAADTLRIEKK